MTLPAWDEVKDKEEEKNIVLFKFNHFGKINTKTK